MLKKNGPISALDDILQLHFIINILSSKFCLAAIINSSGFNLQRENKQWSFQLLTCVYIFFGHPVCIYAYTFAKQNVNDIFMLENVQCITRIFDHACGLI